MIRRASESPTSTRSPKSRLRSRRICRGDQAESGEQTTRLAIAKGLISEGPARLIRELEKQHKVRLYLVSNSAQLLAEVDRPVDMDRARRRKCGPSKPKGEPIAAGRWGASGADGAARRAAVGDRAAYRRPEHRGEPLAKARSWPRQGSAAVHDRAGKRRAGPRHRADRAPGRRRGVRRRRRAVPGQAARPGLRRREGRWSGSRSSSPARKDPKRPRELESKEVDAPADGQPKRVELIHHPKTTGERTFIIEVDQRPRELQTDNNRIERVVTVRKEKLRVLYVDSEPRYEFRYLKNYLERDETIDLNVVLLSSDPEYSEQDRSALPTFPAAKDDLFAYDVVIFGDADTSFMSQSQMQNLVEFVTEKGGGVLFVAGELFNPLSYHGTPLELLLPIELSDARNPTAVGTTVSVVPARADARRARQPDLPLRRRRRREHADLGAAPRALLVLRGTAQEAGGAGAGRASRRPSGRTASCRWSSTSSSGAGKAMFHAFDDTWRWRFRAGDRYFGRFWVQTIRFLARSRLVGQRQAEVQTDRRRYQRGQPIQLRVRFPEPRPGAHSGDVTVQVGRRGQGPRKLTLKLVPGTKNVFEGALPQAAEGDYEVRLLPPPVLEGPIPTASFPSRCAGQRVRTHRNERARADPRGRVDRRQVLHAS